MKFAATLMAAIVIATAGAAFGQQSEIQVQKVSVDSYVLVLKSLASNNVAAAQQELLPEARRICGTKTARFGKYQFEHSEPISPNAKKRPFLLKQEVQCTAAASAPTTVVTDPNWRPSPEQQKVVLALTERYFALKDAGDLKQARTLLAETLAWEDWLVGAEKFNNLAGKVRQRLVNKVTWYPKGPTPGIFAAVDFTGEFDNIGIYCGYVIWHQGPGSTFRLLREEQNYISREMEQRIGAEELAVARKKLRC